MEVVMVKWLDARGVSGRISAKEAKRESLLLVTTAGILVSMDDDAVRVAQDWWHYEDSDGTEPEVYRELEVIPARMVVSLRRWDMATGLVDQGHILETPWWDADLPEWTWIPVASRAHDGTVAKPVTPERQEPPSHAGNS